METIEQIESTTENHRQEGGFSFIEIMIVVVIMAGIVAIVGPAVFEQLDKAKIDQSKIQMKSLVGALDLYYLDNSVYPTTEQGLEALITKPEVGIIPNNWRSSYLRGKKMPKDAWGHDFFYQSDGSSIDMKSFGADGQEGGEGINADIPLE